MSDAKDYLLGVNAGELDRLRFQHEVWRDVTSRFFDRLGVGNAWDCLDVGAGPGFVAQDLRERVGKAGSVTVIEPSQMYLERLKDYASANGWDNIQFLTSTAEQADLPEKAYNLIFARWVFSFVQNPDELISHLVPSLKTGAIIALQDYAYEGLSLYPRGGAFEMMPDAVRAYYRSSGGDPYIATKLPAIFRKHGLQLTDFTPHSLAGGPDSGIMEWAHRFFATHIQAMVDRGVLSPPDGEAVWADWRAHRENPDAIFFAPIVVDVAARKTG